MEPVADHEPASRRPTEHRAANAHAASHGYGAARAMAHRLVADWSSEEAPGRAAVCVDQPEQAQTYAESIELPFEDYLTELRAMAEQGVAPAGGRSGGGDDTDGGRRDNGAAFVNGHRDELYAVYAAGFDIGFRSALIEQCEALTESRMSERIPSG
jgi:hypothetical protein